MFKRVVWFGTGVVVGAGGTVWAGVRLRRAVAEVTPGGMADQAIGAARRLGGDIVAAVSEGRDAMRETEALLRRELAPPPSVRSMLDLVAPRSGATETTGIEARGPGSVPALQPGRAAVGRR